MRFLAAIVDALVAFVQRNPLLVLGVVVLALVAPTLLKGIAAFVLYMFFGFFFLVGIAVLLFRRRIRRVQRDMEREFGRGFGDASPGGRQGREGDVRVYKTPATPEKRVARDVGDYVDFEETKEK